MIPSMDEKDRALDDLFRSYRQATGFDDASPDFMPALWQRIESRRRGSLLVERVARIFAAATVALTLAAGVWISRAPARPDLDSWVETLANHHLAQNTSYYEPVQLSAANGGVPRMLPQEPR